MEKAGLGFELEPNTETCALFLVQRPAIFASLAWNSRTQARLSTSSCSPWLLCQNESPARHPLNSREKGCVSRKSCPVSREKRLLPKSREMVVLCLPAKGPSPGTRTGVTVAAAEIPIEPYNDPPPMTRALAGPVRTAIWGAVLVTSFFRSPCGTMAGPPRPGDQTARSPQQAAEAAFQRIGAGDALCIFLIGHDSCPAVRFALVGMNGTVNLGPQFGPAASVPVSGLTAEEAGAAIQRRVCEILKRPLVHLSVQRKNPFGPKGPRLGFGDEVSVDVLGPLLYPCSGGGSIDDGVLAVGPNYGINYGRMRVEGLTIDEANAAVNAHLQYPDAAEGHRPDAWPEW